MAKKVLTPEEVKVKLEKKSEKRKLFFGTFTKALAFFLAIAMAYSLAVIAFTPATVSTGNTGVTQNGGQQSNGGSVDTDDDVDFGGNDISTPSGDSGSASTPSGDSGSASTPSGDSGSSNSQQSAQVSNADVAKALNEATAKAAKASYSFERTAQFTKNIDVGGLTGILDGIIKGVDENSDLNSVVGGFLGIKKDPIKGEVKNGAGEGFDAKYMIKAMNLTEADIQKAQVNGNTYQVQIKTCTNPDENSAWAHASNDYITFKEVNESIAGAVGSAVKVEESGSQATYKNILIVAVIENGNLTSLKYSYTFDATIKIKAGLTATGTGAAKMENTFSNFKY